MVIAKVDRDGREIIIGPAVKRIIADPTVQLTRDPVALAVGVLGTVHEKTAFDGAVIAARLNDFFHKEDGAFLQFPHTLTQGSVTVDLHHPADAVQAGQGLAGRINCVDIEIVPGNIATFVRSDGRLDIGRCQP